MSNRRGIPAVPPSLTPELYSFLSRLKQNVEVLQSDTDDLLVSIGKAVVYSEGHVFTNDKIASGTFVPTPRNGAIQRIQNGGAHTLRPPTENCTLVLLYENVASAGAITITNFTLVTGTAAPPSNGTTAGKHFMAIIRVVEGFSWLAWQALD